MDHRQLEMKPRILINIHYMEIGGAERALLGLLYALDPERVDVDLLINQHTGEFMSLIPDWVNVLPEIPEYSSIERPIKTIVKEGHWGIALRRVFAKFRHQRYLKALTAEQRQRDASVFQYVANSTEGGLPDLHHLGEYDLAISFLQPHNIVLRKVKAKKKICWIHTDYSTIHINHDLELPIWDGFDHIVSISPECTRAFTKCFPELSGKIIEIENILSADMIRTQAEQFSVETEMPSIDGEIKILTIGRFCPPKRIEGIPEICRRMLDTGIRFKWYVVGYGPDAEIRQNIKRFNVEDTMILLGKKSNPYPYIKACDLYAQPSIYEGKSVTVREAQLLGKPVVISRYPTAASQLTDGVDGRIIDLDIAGCAQGIAEFIRDKEGRAQIAQYLETHDLSNQSEVEKIYSLI